MSLKDMSYLELRQPLCLVERNYLCNFGRRHHEEQLCEIILNLDQWFRTCRLKILLIWSSGGPFVQWSGTICAILVENIMRNNSVNFFLNLGQWFRMRCCLKDFLSGALVALLFSGAEPFMQF